MVIRNNLLQLNQVTGIDKPLNLLNVIVFWVCSSPPPYITANMMEEIQDTWLLVTSKITSISLKKTVMDLGKA